MLDSGFTLPRSSSEVMLCTVAIFIYLHCACVSCVSGSVNTLLFSCVSCLPERQGILNNIHSLY